MALINNWITQALNKLSCKTQEYNSFQFRQLKLALAIEELIAIDPASILEDSTSGFTLQYIYDRIKCGQMLSGNAIAQAEALVQSKKTNAAGPASFAVYGSGTGYTLTATSAALDFASTDPNLVITSPGKYIISARMQIRYAGATFHTSREIVSKITRTNNSLLDLPNSQTTIPTGIVTTETGVLEVFTLPSIVYETTRSDDILKIYSSVAVLPTAGTVVVTEASIVATRI